MIAAALWAIDALIRTDLTNSIPPYSIVFFEHVLGLLLLSPILVMSFKKFKTLKPVDWLNIFGIGIIASVLGTLLFTEALSRSFSAFDFATPVLLQKLQPLFVISLSFVFLREKISLKFISLVPLTLIGSYMISFGTESVDLSFEGKELVFALAIGAALSWSIGTVLGRKMLQKVSFTELTALRFLIAVPFSYIVPFILSKFIDYEFQPYNPMDLSAQQILRFVFIIFTSGVVAMLIYYRGLKSTEAKVATLAELIFVAVSLLIAVTELNPYGSPQELQLANVFGIVILVITVLVISLEQTEAKKQK